MAQHGKLRVALEDRDDALQLVRTELYDAAGLIAEPYFQELDQPGELLIEVRVDGAGGYTPTELAKMVAGRTQHLHVLCAGIEPADPVIHPRAQCQVIDLLGCEVPDLALRAHHDGMPTARWQPSPTHIPHWLLAVPGFDADRRAVVGICRRTGYYYRFSASEAASVALTVNAQR